MFVFVLPSLPAGCGACSSLGGSPHCLPSPLPPPCFWDAQCVGLAAEVSALRNAHGAALAESEEALRGLQAEYEDLTR